MTAAEWVAYAPAVVCLVALVVVFRWLLYLQRRVNDHAERVAHLEGQRERNTP